MVMYDATRRWAYEKHAWGIVARRRPTAEPTRLRRIAWGIVARHHDSLITTMTDEQKDIFERFDDCWSEYASLAEKSIFVYAFRLGGEHCDRYSLRWLSQLTKNINTAYPIFDVSGILYPGERQHWLFSLILTKKSLWNRKNQFETKILTLKPNFSNCNPTLFLYQYLLPFPNQHMILIELSCWFFCIFEGFQAFLSDFAPIPLS